MPKKFKGDNSKAVEARVRKDAALAAEQEKKKQAEEDALWEDDDKHVARKQQRKDEKEKKRLEQLERKKELQKLADEEMSNLKSGKVPTPSSKVTRAMVQANLEAEGKSPAAAVKGDLPHDEQPIEENLNRLVIEGDEARSVEDAISVLGKGDPEVDRHPEKRMKAAFLVYEEKNLPILKAENPTMRLSQLKQMLKKDWMKSTDNPLNQHMAAQNQKR
ncbi:hypothetical protein ACOMHN_016780 [Nucella lapillus]